MFGVDLEVLIKLFVLGCLFVELVVFDCICYGEIVGYVGKSDKVDFSMIV